MGIIVFLLWVIICILSPRAGCLLALIPLGFLIFVAYIIETT